MPTPHPIKALDQNVVNKIAAGEIIVAPVNALKELIENAVDAGSTSIEISVKDGGLKLLQITDNGSGINRDDLPILCERFTTSKLKVFEDLESIGTYGFRGEALASISMIAHLTVTTKTAESNCAWRAVYSDGKLVPPKPGQSADPKPCAGKQGTQITVEDLFYNTPSRRRAFRSSSEEYSKILNVVGRYAVHCEGVSFTCKKHGDNDYGVSTVSNSNLVDRIRRVHGSAVANEVIDFKFSNAPLGFQAKGMISNANYSVKKTTLLLFINGRSVDSSSIKKAIDATYTVFLPKGGHPFVYLSIEIEPHRVDVNIHPTKREVSFLHEDEIVEKIAAAMHEKLAAVDTSRSYALTQTLLPGTTPQADNASPLKRRAQDKASGTRPTKKPYENNTVRVDPRDQKITSMLHPVGGDPDTSATAATEATSYSYDPTRSWYRIPYTNINLLRDQVRETAHDGLAELFLNHIYVGQVDPQRRLAAVQHGVKLYLVDYAAVSYEMFYQIALSDFNNIGRIRLDPPLPVRDLLQIAVEEEKALERSKTEALLLHKDSNTACGGGNDDDGDNDAVMRNGESFDWEGATKTVLSLLMDHRGMLRDHYSLDINDAGQLVSIPLLLKGYTPNLGKLPSFLLRLGPNVDWTEEITCFSTLLRELALFYVPAPTPSGPPPPSLETVLFPAFRRRLVPTDALLGSVTEVANLKGLYRIFERSC